MSGQHLWRPLGTNAGRLAAAIAEFEAALPGWWWSVGACSISRDASCGPDRTGPDADLLKLREFDEGFHHDGKGDVADSLSLVMNYAVQQRDLARNASATITLKPVA